MKKSYLVRKVLATVLAVTLLAPFTSSVFAQSSQPATTWKVVSGNTITPVNNRDVVIDNLIVNGACTGCGGGGGGDMQDAYDVDPNILYDGLHPLAVRASGIPYGGFSAALLGADTTGASPFAIGVSIVKEGTGFPGGLPGVAIQYSVLADTAVTFPSPTSIEFGVDLVAAGAIASGGSTTITIKDSNVPGDESIYGVTSFSNGIATNSIANLSVNYQTLAPANITSVTGTATVGLQGESIGSTNQHYYAASFPLTNPALGGNLFEGNNFGGTLSSGAHLSNDTGIMTHGYLVQNQSGGTMQDNYFSYNAGAITSNVGWFYNEGTVAGNMLLLENGAAGTVAGSILSILSADPVATLAGLRIDMTATAAADINLQGRPTAPTSQAGDLWHDSNVGRLRFDNGTPQSLAYLSDVSLQGAYDVGNNISLDTIPFAVTQVGQIGYGEINQSNIISDTVGSPNAVHIAYGAVTPAGGNHVSFGVLNNIVPDTSVTFPAANQIEFGVDLLAAGALFGGAQGTGIIMKYADVNTDEGLFFVIALSNGITTNSIATVIDSSTFAPPVFTSTIGTANVSLAGPTMGAGNASFQAYGNLATMPSSGHFLLGVNSGGQMTSGITIDNRSGQMDHGIDIGNDPGASMPVGMRILNNSGGIMTGPMIVLQNDEVGGNADKVSIQFANLSNSADIKFTARANDAGLVTSGDMWYNITDGRLRLQTGGLETIAFLSDVTAPSLQTAYNGGNSISAAAAAPISFAVLDTVGVNTLTLTQNDVTNNPANLSLVNNASGDDISITRNKVGISINDTITLSDATGVATGSRVIIDSSAIARTADAEVGYTAAFVTNAGDTSGHQVVGYNVDSISGGASRKFAHLIGTGWDENFVALSGNMSFTDYAPTIRAYNSQSADGDGFDLTIQGSNGFDSGVVARNGGNVVLTAGTAVNGGTDGIIALGSVTQAYSNVGAPTLVSDGEFAYNSTSDRLIFRANSVDETVAYLSDVSSADEWIRTGTILSPSTAGDQVAIAGTTTTTPHLSSVNAGIFTGTTTNSQAAIRNTNADTEGTQLYIETNSDASANGASVFFNASNAAFDQQTLRVDGSGTNFAQQILTTGTGGGLFINQNNASARGLLVDSDNQASNAAEIVADSATTGGALVTTSSSTSAATRILNLFESTSAAATGTTVLKVSNASTGLALDVVGNERISGTLTLATTTATAGQIKQGANVIFHTYTESNPNIFIGEGAGNFTLDLGNNIGIGQNVLNDLTSGGFNTAVGSNAGTAMTTASDNSLFGNAAGQAITIGERNVGVGQNALFTVTTTDNNTAVGTNAGRIITGAQNTFLGSSAGFTGTTAAITNSTGIGYNAQVTASNTMVLGNGVTVVAGATAPTSASDKMEVVGNLRLTTGRLLGASAAATAANDLTLGNANQFIVSGATQINAITTAGWTAGSQITLIFSGAPTVKNNTAGGAGTAVLLLAGSADLTAAANTVLGLTFDGTSWQETSRKVQ